MIHKLKFLCVVIFLILITDFSFGQYPPPPGFTGTTAISKDSSVFYAWAKTCTVIRGFVNIADTNFFYNNSNRASYGNVYMATGIPDGLVLSLGDGGIATLTFDTVISDHIGWDFAVFENSFSDGFLELAYVEVSSDGVNFVRFPSVSLTQTQVQVGTFDTMDTRKINNLAGKYRLLYGTPFDLIQLKDSALLDINHITQIRIIDVVGCIQDEYARYDSQNHKINDPWPTPFDTGGFDLDGVGLVHNAPAVVNGNISMPEVSIIPNPCLSQAKFFAGTSTPLHYEITDQTGRILIQSSFSVCTHVDISALPAGIYFVNFTSSGPSFRLTKKLLKY
ncbi:MAG: T9SS type A sorting domain-containing protein [Bacteroidetes bacterium]|nr:T9SS type A sorting domain-containing protein [Bacteroidota bacterium]